MIIFTDLKGWFLSEYNDGGHDFSFRSKVDFIFRFIVFHLLISTFMLMFCIFFLKTYTVVITVFSISYNLFILFLFRRRKKYKLALHLYIWCQLLLVACLLFILMEIHIAIIVWFIIPVVFSHFTLGKNVLALGLLASFVVLVSIMICRIHEITFVTFEVSEALIDFYTPFIVLPALVILYFLFSAYSESQDFATLQLRKQKDKIASTIESKENVIRIVAHDLKGPISSIIGLSNLINSSLVREPDNLEEVLDYNQKILTTCEYSHKLIEQLMIIEQLENQQDDIRLTKMNVVDVIRKSIDSNHALALEKQIDVFFQTENQDFYIHGDAIRLEQAFSNLVSNSLKFSYPKSVVNIQVTKEGNYVVCELKDKGMGIPFAYREILFDKFTKAKRRGTIGESTHGLGLSITQQIVQLHSGALSFDSVESVGTSFYVKLPLLV